MVERGARSCLRTESSRSRRGSAHLPAVVPTSRIQTIAIILSVALANPVFLLFLIPCMLMMGAMVWMMLGWHGRRLRRAGKEVGDARSSGCIARECCVCRKRRRSSGAKDPSGRPSTCLLVSLPAVRIHRSSVTLPPTATPASDGARAAMTDEPADGAATTPTAPLTATSDGPGLMGAHLHRSYRHGAACPFPRVLDRKPVD